MAGRWRRGTTTRTLGTLVVAGAVALAAGPAGAAQAPHVGSVVPRDGATGVARDAAVTASLVLPNDVGVDRDTMNVHSVRLYRVGDDDPLPASVNTTAAGDSVTLTPLSYLDPHTRYRFEVTADLTDGSGAGFSRTR